MTETEATPDAPVIQIEAASEEILTAKPGDGMEPEAPAEQVVELPQTPEKPKTPYVAPEVPVYPDETYDEDLIGYDAPKELLPRGMTAQEVATKFYTALYENDLDHWLATLCESNKTHPVPSKPGGFATVGWKLGRNKLRKYGTHYNFVEEESEDPEKTKPPSSDMPWKVTLSFSALYGKVPGYIPDTKIRENVKITLLNELDEWRVLEADF